VVKYAFRDVTDIGSSLQMRPWLLLLVKTRVARGGRELSRNWPEMIYKNQIPTNHFLGSFTRTA
jgi:hypothetical protein